MSGLGRIEKVSVLGIAAVSNGHQLIKVTPMLGKKSNLQSGLLSNVVFLRFIKKEYKHIKSRLGSYSGCILQRLDI